METTSVGHTACVPLRSNSSLTLPCDVQLEEHSGEEEPPLLEESFKLLRASIPSTIQMKLEINTRADTAHMNGGQIQQGVMNLCSNAAYAMRRNGGLLTVSLVEETPRLEDSSDPKPRK